MDGRLKSRLLMIRGLIGSVRYAMQEVAGLGLSIATHGIAANTEEHPGGRPAPKTGGARSQPGLGGHQGRGPPPASGTSAAELRTLAARGRSPTWRRTHAEVSSQFDGVLVQPP